MEGADLFRPMEHPSIKADASAILSMSNEGQRQDRSISSFLSLENWAFLHIPCS